MVQIENAVAKVEQLLNPVDWVPCIASFSGMVRILAGIVEVIAGMVFAYIKSVYILLTTTKGKIYSALDEGGIYCLHGFANIFRGAIAMLPGVNLILWFHDNKLGRFNYPHEQMKPGVYPIATAKRLAKV